MSARVRRHIAWMLCNKSDEFLLAYAAVFVWTFEMYIYSWVALLSYKYSYIEFNTAELVIPRDIFTLFRLSFYRSPIHVFAFYGILSPDAGRAERIAKFIDGRSNRPYLFSSRHRGRVHGDKTLFSIQRRAARLYILNSISFCKISLIAEDRERKGKTDSCAICLQHFVWRIVTPGKQGRYPINHLF